MKPNSHSVSKYGPDVRYKLYCDYCKQLGIKPADFDYWYMLNGV